VTSVKDMSLKEAAGTAIAILLGDPNRKSKYTGEDWQAELREAYDIEDNEGWESLSDNGSAWQEAKYESSEDTFDGLTAKVISEYGGEGQGDQYWMVVSLSDGDTTRYFRKDGWYASYDGGSLDGDTSEVKPAEKVIVVYE
jgi:hypothetical protein